MSVKCNPNDVMRSMTFSMIKPILDNVYEDECYELAYTLHPKLMNFIKNYGIKNETDIIKIFISNKKMYDKCKEINDLLNAFNEFYKMQIILQVVEFMNKMEESRNYMQQAYALKAKYNLV
jgi:hypothetical protein